MIPREPPRRPSLGFVYIPPYRIHGISVAGEESSLIVPELDLAFDVGRSPRAILPASVVALSHGHMDHSAGLAYYYSQRRFQGMGVGRVVCHPALVQPIRRLMQAWVELEAQTTPYELTALEPEDELEIRNKTFLRAFATDHTVPSLGFVVIERRSKLREEFAGLPQERLVQLKSEGVEITRTLEIPLVCYTGDTAYGPHLEREDVLNARVLITEATFLDPGHRSRAGIGRHLHLDDVVRLIANSRADGVVLTHLSRRTSMPESRKMIQRALPEADHERVHLLMDHRTNRARYERKVAEAEAEAQTQAPADDAAGE